MKNLDKAKLKLLKVKKEYGFVVFDDIVNISAELGIDDIDQLVSFLEQRGINIYEDADDAEEHGEVVLWEEEKYRFESLEKISLMRAKSNNNLIDMSALLDLAAQYELDLSDDQVDDLLTFLKNNDVTVNHDEDYDDDDDDEEYDEEEIEPNFYPSGCRFFVQPLYLKHLCNSTTFNRGKVYFQLDRVSCLKYGLSSYRAKVAGTQEYNVRITFADGDIYSHECDCPAHSNYDGPCKHIVAAILYANSEVNMDDIVEKNKGLPDGFEPIGDNYVLTETDVDEIYDYLCEKSKTAFDDNTEIDLTDYLNFVSESIREYSGDYRRFDWSENDFVYIDDELKKRNITIYNPYEDYAGTSDSESTSCDYDSDYDPYYDDSDYDNEDDYDVDNGYRDDYDYGED